MSNLNIASLFAETAAEVTSKPKAKSEFWLNIGYINAGNTKYPFVSLSLGVPVDSLILKDVSKIKDPEYANFMKRCNKLTSLITEAAKSLKPGQSVLLGEPKEGEIAVQLLRVNAATAPDYSTGDDDTFALKLS